MNNGEEPPLEKILAEAAVLTEAQDRSRELHLARDHAPALHGAFVHHLLLAFVNADRQNFDLLFPVMEKIIEKYGLKCTCDPDNPDRLKEP